MILNVTYFTYFSGAAVSIVNLASLVEKYFMWLLTIVYFEVETAMYFCQCLVFKSREVKISNANFLRK